MYSRAVAQSQVVLHSCEVEIPDAVIDPFCHLVTCILSVVLGRYMAIYSNTDNSINCGQILPENLSSMRVTLYFPINNNNNGIDHR